jgi:hypothetical protein
MTLEQEIRSWLRRYLRNEIPFEMFEDWFVDRTWDVQQEGSETERALTYAIERHIGEYTSQCRTEAQLKRALRAFAPTWWATPRGRGSWTTVRYGVSEPDRPPIRPGYVVADRGPEAVRD